MKYLFTVSAFLFFTSGAGAQGVAPPDTLRGIALVLADNAANPDALPDLQLCRVYAVQVPVNVTTTGKNHPVSVTGTATRLMYFATNGAPIASDDVLIFKKRPWKK